MSAPFSVIIPAHNEEHTIEACLGSIRPDAQNTSGCEIVVVANGCSDKTADIARRASGDIRVAEIAEGSKAKALNHGISLAAYHPRIFVDADVQVSFASLSATADALKEPGIMAAAPRLTVDTQRSDRFVKAYYRIWLKLPYVTDGLVGSGIYALSEEASRRIGNFPLIFGDDIWVRNQFRPSERRTVTHDACGRPAYFTVQAPRTIRSLIRIEARRRVGDAQARELHPKANSARSNSSAHFVKILRDGAAPGDIAVYLAVKVISRLIFWMRGFSEANHEWSRDETIRGKSESAPHG